MQTWDKNFVDKTQLKTLVNCNFFNQISATILTQKFILRLKRNLWCIFESDLASPNIFHQGRSGVKIDAQPCAGRWLFLQIQDTSVQPSYSFGGCHRAKTSKLKCWFLWNQGVFCDNFLSKKTASLNSTFSEIHETVLDYDYCTDIKIFYS